MIVRRWVDSLMVFILGGPLFYWWLSRNDKEKISSYIEKIVWKNEQATKRKRLDEKEEKLR